MKKSLIILTLTSALFLLTRDVYAAGTYGSYGSHSQYSGTPAPGCLVVDKLVSNPAVTNKLEFVDNILTSGAKYQPGAQVIARFHVKNVSNRILNNVKVIDYLPAYVSYVSGPGSYDASKNEVTTQLDTFKADEVKVYYLTLKIANAGELPEGQSVVVVKNRVVVYGDNCTNDDHAQMVIEKNVKGLSTKGGIDPVHQEQLKAVKTAPKAGPAYMAVVTLGSVALGWAGVTLKRVMS